MQMLKYLASSLRRAILKIAEVSKQPVIWDFDTQQPQAGALGSVTIVKIEPKDSAQAAIIAAIGNSAAVKYGQKTGLLGDPEKVELVEKYAAPKAKEQAAPESEEKPAKGRKSKKAAEDTDAEESAA